MKLQGTGVALVTPFNENGSVDENGLRKLVDYQIENGTNFLVVQGSTGEAATLTASEKELTLKIVIEQNKGRLPIVLGLASNNTAELVEAYKNIDATGIDAFLCASPHYNKPSQRGIIAHFTALAKVAQSPIILYNVPGRTSSNMTAATTLELAKVDNIIGIKEASGNIEQVMDILKDRPKDFAVVSGEDALTMPLMAMGADGVISVVANGLPKTYSSMVDAMLQGNIETAQKLHFSMLDITKSFFAEGNPSGIKCCLDLLDICRDYVRLPLTSVSKELRLRMENELKKFK
ncbi:MAG: 4-hydroxy-tetrahydrodipicolinate synthase [Brumimicrobium sp.]|nr:4-hydroxy-tetrahydrodipicolinate synthase [Brumimicrobium sp.]